MPNKLLERSQRDPIVTLLSSVKTLRVRQHNRDILYPVPVDQYRLHHTSPDGQVRANNSRVESNAGSTEDMGSFQTVYQTSHRELREMSDLSVEDAGMHQASMVRYFVPGIQEVLQQE